MFKRHLNICSVAVTGDREMLSRSQTFTFVGLRSSRDRDGRAQGGR